MEANPVIESANFIAKESRFVRLGSKQEFESAASKLEPLLASYKAEDWRLDPLNPTELPEPKLKVAWVFLVDTMNFAFWTPCGQQPFTVSYKGKQYTGYRSMCAAVMRSLDSSTHILDANFWATSTPEDWSQIFKSDNSTPIPFLNERVRVINEAGRCLLGSFGGSAFQMVSSANHSALSLIKIVTDNITSYRDEHSFHGRKVKIYKRVQILAADLHFAFLADDNEVARECRFSDIEKLTMFADYRVPQALCYLGALHYNEELIARLATKPELASGSEMEVEIRGNSIVAVEKIKEALNGRYVSVLIDFILWSYAKDNEGLMRSINIHHTSSVFY